MGKNWKKNKAGIEALRKRLNAVPKPVRDEVEQAQIKNAKEAVSIIRNDVPTRQGELKRAVMWTRGNPSEHLYQLSVYKPKQTGSKRISIFVSNTMAPHAHLVHNGTGSRRRKNGGSTGVMPPQPFFWPNMYALSRRHKSRMTRAGTRAIKRLVERG